MAALKLSLAAYQAAISLNPPKYSIGELVKLPQGVGLVLKVSAYNEQVKVFPYYQYLVVSRPERVFNTDTFASEQNYSPVMGWYTELQLAPSEEVVL